MTDFWETTEKLDIYLDDYKVITNYMEYPLYENLFYYGMKRIFNIAAAFGTGKEKGRCVEEKDFKGNIYTFLGGRGTGKTTALKAFCSILKRMDDDRAKQWWLEKTCDEDVKKQLWNKSFYFHVIHTIDASLLEKKEDLFELILVSLYNRFVKNRLEKNMDTNIGNAQMMRLNRLFEETLSTYRAVRGENNSIDYNVSSLIRFLGTSREINESMKRLIDELMNLSGKKWDYEYFVLSLDDLDLNLDHGYDMLEQLQKYFVSYKIIILLAVDYNQMRAVCTEHFHASMPHTAREAENADGHDSYSKEMANSYITKVFPVSQRLFMPDMTNKSSKIRIRGNDRSLSVKEHVLVMIAKAMGIFFCMSIKERHFLEPDTVRNLVVENDFLHELEKFDVESLKLGRVIDRKIKRIRAESSEENLRILRMYDKKLERFNWEIEKRYAQIKLEPVQMKRFQELLKFDLVKKPAYFISQYEYIYGGFKGEENRARSFSYGEVLETLDKYTERNMEEKDFASCFMLSYTSELTWKYMNFLYHPDKTIREAHKAEWEWIIGDSFGNAWLGDTLPNILVRSDKMIREIKIGYLESPMFTEIKVNISMDALQNLKSSDKDNWKMVLRQWLLETELVTFCECLEMLFVEKNGNSYDPLSVDLQLGFPANKVVYGDTKNHSSESKVLQVSCNPGIYKLDVWGFIATMLDYDYDKLLSHIIDEIIWCVCRYLEDELDWSEDNDYDRKEMSHILDELVCEMSSLRDIQEEERIVFPFYNIDLSYNIFRNLRQSFGNRRVYGHDILRYIYELYRNMERCLIEEEEAYQSVDRNLKMDYVERFSKCPYIEMIKSIYEKKEKSKVPRMVSQALLQVVLRPESPEKASDD